MMFGSDAFGRPQERLARMRIIYRLFVAVWTMATAAVLFILSR